MSQRRPPASPTPGAAASAAKVYDSSVFVNRPFDEDYLPLLWAAVFTIGDCGFLPRTALKAVGTAATRLHRIADLIAQSRHSIHDLSRIESDAATGLPRFNMPFELGLAFGAVLYRREPAHRKRDLLLMARDRFKDKSYLSDLAGQDGDYHGGHRNEVVRAVRKFLASKAGDRPVRGHVDIQKRLQAFEQALPAIGAALPTPLSMDELDTLDYLSERMRAATIWQAATP